MIPMSFAAWAALFHLMAFDQTIPDLVRLGAYSELTEAGYATADQEGCYHLTLAGIDVHSRARRWSGFRLGYVGYVHSKEA